MWKSHHSWPQITPTSAPLPLLPLLSGHLQRIALIIPPDEHSSTLFNLILGAYSTLNVTQSELIKSCWLCLSSAINGSNIETTKSSQCPWEGTLQLMLQEVSRQGLCVCTIPADKQFLCASTKAISATKANTYILPVSGTRWACSTGLISCISASVLSSQNHYCVMIRLYPRVLYHDAQTFEDQMLGQLSRHKREPVSLRLAA